MKSFNLLNENGAHLPIKEIWMSKDIDPMIYDLAVIVLDSDTGCIPFWLDNPVVLDKVLTMGYPPIPGFDAVMISETASIGSYVFADQKAAPGEVVSEEVAPYNAMGIDHFIITSRVKGGNSGSPVINSHGKVVGTVIQIPFDSLGSSKGGRYDIMGFGICIPSKYMSSLIENHQVIPVRCDDDKYLMG
jgi:serine protease Do